MSTDQKGNRTPLIVGVAALLALISIFYFFWNSGYNWHLHSYRSDDKEPYGADLSLEYLKALRPAAEFSVADSSIATNLAPFIGDSADMNYVVLGYLPYLDSLDMDHLFRFAEQGNSVFLLAGAVPSQVLEELHNGECLLYEEEIEYDYYNGFPGADKNSFTDSVIQVNFAHPDLRRAEDFEFGHYNQDKLEKYPWPYLDSAYFCSENTSLTALGNIHGQVNFFRVKAGKGYIYGHTNPKLLTNFYLIQDEGKEYADRVFAHLEEGAIIWDDKKWKAPKNQEYYKERYHQNEGALSYLLSQESLKWALYLLFGGAVLFFVFASRRKQRPIRVIRPKENSSLEYVETISGLYYTQSGDGRIFRYLSDQFQFFIRNRYRIQFRWKESDSWAVLAKASGIPLSHIEKIADKESKGSYEPNVDGVMLTEYYKLIDHFYSNCK